MSVLSTTIVACLLFICLNFSTVDSAAKIKVVKCSHKFERYYLRFAPFFYNKLLVSASLPCRYKLANIQCGDTQAEVLGDVDRHAHYTSKLNHFLRGVSVSLTVGGQSAVYSINNDTFKVYRDAQIFSNDPWQKNGAVDVKSYFFQNGTYERMSAVIERGGLTIRYTWQSEYESDWNHGFIYNSGGPVLDIVCNDTFSSYEGFPNTTCGHVGFNSTTLLSDEDNMEEFPQDLHHVASRNLYYGNFAMLSSHNVKQIKPLCEAAAVAVKENCPGQGKYQQRGEVFYECQESYKSILYCAQLKGFDPLKWYVACLRILCATEGEATAAETCSTLYETERECGYYFNHKPIKEFYDLTTCPPDPTAPTTAPTPLPTPFDFRAVTTKEASWPSYIRIPECSVSDRHFYGYTLDETRNVYPSYVKTFAYSFVWVNLPCRYKLAEFRCGGAGVTIDVQFETDVKGIIYPYGVRIDINTEAAARIEINHSHLKKLMDRSDLSDVPAWVAHIRAQGRVVTSEGIRLSYDAARQCLALQREELYLTFCYVDALNASRPDSNVVVISCNATDFRSRSLPEALCGDGKFYSGYELIKSVKPDSHHVSYMDADSLFFVQQDVQQTTDACREVKDILSLGPEGCQNYGDNLFECQYLTRYNTFYGRCLLVNKIDHLRVLTACMHVLCGTETAKRAQTCAVLQEVADTCGASPPALSKLLQYYPRGVHMQLATLLSKAGCNS